MRGNIVAAAVVFGIAMVVSSVVLVVGIRWVVNGAVGRVDQTIEAHGRSVERAGGQAGVPIQAALKDVAAAFDRPSQAIEHAGDKISHPQIPLDYTIKLQGPVAIQQPLLIRGPATDGAMPVNARIAK